MAIAYETSAKGSVVTSSPATCSIDAGSGSNVVALAFVLLESTTSAPSCSACTYDGVTMQSVASVGASGAAGYSNVSAWLLHNPNRPGAKTVSATISTYSQAIVIVIILSGAAQSSTADASKTGTATSTGAKTVTVTTIANNSWVACGCSLAALGPAISSPTHTSRQSATLLSNFGVCNVEDTNAAKTPAGNVSIGFTIAGTAPAMAMVGVSIAPYTAAASAAIPVYMNIYRQMRN
jgi:hypothetical protein